MSPSPGGGMRLPRSRRLCGYAKAELRKARSGLFAQRWRLDGSGFSQTGSSATFGQYNQLCLQFAMNPATQKCIDFLTAGELAQFTVLFFALHCPVQQFAPEFSGYQSGLERQFIQALLIRRVVGNEAGKITEQPRHPHAELGVNVCFVRCEPILRLHQLGVGLR